MFKTYVRVHFYMYPICTFIPFFIVWQKILNWDVRSEGIMSVGFSAISFFNFPKSTFVCYPKHFALKALQQVNSFNITGKTIAIHVNSFWLIGVTVNRMLSEMSSVKK